VWEQRGRGSLWNGREWRTVERGWEGGGPILLSPFPLSPPNTVRMVLFSGHKAFRGPRKMKKKKSLSSKVELVKIAKCGR
jgi:hypothetical protein